MVSQHALQVVSQYALQQVSRGGGVVFQHALQVSRTGISQVHTQRGEVEGSGLGGLQAHTQGGVSGPHPGGSQGPHLGESPGSHLGGVSQHAMRQIPLPQWLLLQAVHILLECILIYVYAHNHLCDKKEKKAM